MSRFLLSAAAVCALCVSMTGSADAAVRLSKTFIGPKGNLVTQTKTYGARHTWTKTTVTRPNGFTTVHRSVR